jgi:pyruvate-formate lyase-activating enzyme
VTFSKKVLCLGNNSTDTDRQTSKLAQDQNSINHGLITDHQVIPVNFGYYHTSLVDIQPSDLFILIKKFDQLIFLDQPKDQWAHPDAFYLTVQFVKQVESKIHTVWQNTQSAYSINFFEEYVKTNKSFCIFPFIELLVQNKHTTVCCRSSKEITNLDQLLNWQTDPNYTKIRQKMLAGELIPEHCGVCYKYEANNMLSARQQETVEWANRLNLKSLDDLSQIKNPSYYEVRPSNICNLQCRSCVPENSNLIEKEYIKIGLHDDGQTIEYTNFDFVKFDDLKKLYVAGGEPTAMLDLYDFLQKCIDENNVDFEFLINTNATKISNKLKELFSHFTNLQFIISIDGFQDVNHYVRWPSVWESIIENAHYLIDHGHKVAFNITVSIYTISRLDQLLKFLDEEFPGALVHCGLAEFKNDILNPMNYFDSTLKDKLMKIPKLNCYKNSQLLKSFVDGLILHYQEPKSIDIEKIKEFFEFNDLLDQSRNIRLKDYIPELEEYRKRCYNTV